MQSKLINRELYSYYRRVTRSFLQESKVPAGLVGPFLVSCTKRYLQLEKRWMYVGQEPLGWGRATTVADVSDLMQLYVEFDLAKTYKGAGSPFWTFGHRLGRRLNPAGPERSFLWTNLARIGKENKSGRVSQEHLEFWSANRLLATEISVTKPSVIVFVTGPSYDDLLLREFPGAVLPEISLTQPVAMVKHKDLPVATFRSYHPGYLRRKGLEDSVAEFVFKRSQ